jgi:hypothetical protein
VILLALLPSLLFLMLVFALIGEARSRRKPPTTDN